MKYPRLAIDLAKIKHNVDLIVRMCQSRGIRVAGVTKLICGDPLIAAVLLESGIHHLTDSRLRNIIRLRKAGMSCEVSLLRIPMMSEAGLAVRHTDASYQSDTAVIRQFSAAAEKSVKNHKIMIMVEAGDLREGVPSEDLLNVVEIVLSYPRIRFEGLAMNIGCMSGVLPTYQNTSLLVRLRNEIMDRFHLRLPFLSVGGSPCLHLLENEQMPAEINEIRVGEALFLGKSTISQRSIPGAYEDAFELQAEIIEVRDKPSVPVGEIGLDGFGRKPHFIDKGIRKRAILAIGRQDVPCEALTPIMSGVEIVGASSDHMVVDVTDCRQSLRGGDRLSFLPDYSGLLSLMTSPYVKKDYRNRS